MLDVLLNQVIQFAPWLIVASVPLLVFALVPAQGAPHIEEEGVRSRDRSAGRYLAPAPLVDSIDRNLMLAGLAGVWNMKRIVLLKNVLGLIGILLALAIVIPDQDPLRVLIALAFALGPYFIPDLIVMGRAQERQAAIQKSLPDTIDQITISIEAGLGLESAIARAGQHGGGPLADELVRTVQDMRVGLSRRQAYLALADRTTVVDLKRFARAIMQADAYGVPVGNVVRTQSKELRSKRKQRAEEKAMKVPVKVLFPLMLCILPVLFIIILGPPILRLVTGSA